MLCCLLHLDCDGRPLWRVLVRQGEQRDDRARHLLLIDLDCHGRVKAAPRQRTAKGSSADKSTRRDDPAGGGTSLSSRGFFGEKDRCSAEARSSGVERWPHSTPGGAVLMRPANAA